MQGGTPGCVAALSDLVVRIKKMAEQGMGCPAPLCNRAPQPSLHALTRPDCWPACDGAGFGEIAKNPAPDRFNRSGFVLEAGHAAAMEISCCAESPDQKCKARTSGERNLYCVWRFRIE